MAKYMCSDAKRVCVGCADCIVCICICICLRLRLSVSIRVTRRYQRQRVSEFRLYMPRVDREGCLVDAREIEKKEGAHGFLRISKY
jgi:hypothetical protein